jgi:hypothetical protein
MTFRRFLLPVVYPQVSFSNDLPYPMDNYAFNNARLGYVESDDAYFGLRISGSTQSVPESSTMLLIGFGLVSIAGLRCKMKK